MVWCVFKYAIWSMCYKNSDCFMVPTLTMKIEINFRVTQLDYMFSWFGIISKFNFLTAGCNVAARSTPRDLYSLLGCKQQLPWYIKVRHHDISTSFLDQRSNHRRRLHIDIICKVWHCTVTTKATSIKIMCQKCEIVHKHCISTNKIWKVNIIQVIWLTINWSVSAPSYLFSAVFFDFFPIMKQMKLTLQA